MPAPTTPGKIFLADERGLVETSDFRQFSTFHFGSFQHPHKQPLGRLRALNEELLAGGATLALPVAEATHVVLLPITGTVEALPPSGPAIVVEVEEMQVLTLPAGSTLHLHNPYPEDVIRLLHIWIRADAALPPSGTVKNTFSFAGLANQLLPLLTAVPALPFGVSLGRFAGRSEVAWAVPAGRLFFAFVLAGAFEVEGRLVHEKDGLALWNAAASIDIEALSNEALLLVLEVAQ